MVQDLATQWIQSYPCKTKTSQETRRSLQKFLEPDRKPDVFYTDNSQEFGKSCEDSSWNHCTSTPHTSETNGIAERAVRRIKEGPLPYCCSQVWVKNGGRFPWNATTVCGTYKISYLMARHLMRGGSGNHFKGPVVPFGTMVGYHPLSAKDLSRLHLFGSKVLPGIFLGFSLHAGRIWKGEILVAVSEGWTHLKPMLKDSMQRKCQRP